MSNSINYTRQTLRLYWQHMKAYPSLLTGIIGLMPVIQLADDFLSPYLISRIMNQIAKASGPLQLSLFYKPIALILIVELSVNLFWRPYVKMVWIFEESVMRDLYQTSFGHLMTMSSNFFNDRFAGSLVNQVNKFSSAFERMADAMIWNVYKLVIAFIFTVIILAKPAPLYVVAITVFSFIFVAILAHLKKSERPFNERWAEGESERTGQLADSIGNIQAVKAFAHEDLESRLFAAETDNVHALSMATMHKNMRNERYTTTSQRAIGAAAILSSLYLATHFSIPVGTIYLALIYTIGITRRLWDLNSTLRNVNRSFGDAREMTVALAIEPEVKDPANPEASHIHRGAIRFQAVDFAYKERVHELLFNKLDLNIKPGEKVGLVGHSGGGKTTVTKLLLRFMDIQAGEILIDGQNIAKLRQADVRRKIAYVSQEPLLFHRSLLENIRYGDLEASDEAVTAVAKMAHAHEFIEQLPEGYQTLVGERGVKLSGGQRQRVAIARAMLKNAPILLLDEATSALDSESEALIQESLWTLMEGRTAIVIAHRLSTIQRMDRIIVLEHGKIIEEGSHKDLIYKGGAYADLWKRQSGGFLEE